MNAVFNRNIFIYKPLYYLFYTYFVNYFLSLFSFKGRGSILYEINFDRKSPDIEMGERGVNMS
jgi:hypothetical protein